jgi:hypothetical protein
MAVWWAGHAAPAGAVACTVPGTHDTVQEAVFDPSCDLVELADQTFAESVLIDRSLSLIGQSGGQTVLEGRVRVTGPGVHVEMGALAIRSGCPDFAMQIHEGADVNGAVIGVAWSLAFPCPLLGILFADGFESGGTTRWTSAVPP